MTAADVVPPVGASGQHPLGPGADLGVIREHLLPVEREQFDLEVRTAEEAGDTCTFILDRPWDADAFNTRTMGNARLRRFGLDRGSTLYTPMSDRRSVLLNSVHYTA